ncbi:MAG: hypothetical protein P4L53_09075 [Candidatus Obscuribacterales bacterium]|nr:hypothetical protein [Candidatus Obscuribacterales bacterium]
MKVDFAAPLDELSIRRHRRALRSVHRGTSGHERDLQHILLEIDQVLSPYFVADDHIHPVRVLNGLTLTAIVARKGPSELGGFGQDVYARVLRDLQNGGELRQPIAGYPGLEALFADKVAGVIEAMAQDRWKRGKLDQVDEVFYALSTGRKLNAHKQSSLDSSLRLGELELKLEQTGALFSLRGGVGSYVDFNDRVRSVPNLSAVTIQGIASAPAAVEAADASTIDYGQVAKDASAYRRSLHLGGRTISAASAEFHIRIFRAVGLTSADVATLPAESLKALVQKAIDIHARSCEPEATAA